MSTLGVVGIIVASYFTVGVTAACIRAWFLGTHRIRHGGEKVHGCEHPGCDVAAVESLFFTLAFWPVLVPIQLAMILARKVLRAPYLRSLPPKYPGSLEALRREVVDSVMALGSVKHLTDTGRDEKWDRLHKAMEALKEIES